MKKNKQKQNTSKVTVPLAIKPVYLLQRCKVDCAITPENAATMLTGDYLKLDYMGAAEYEFGAVPKFQRSINEKLDKLRPFKVPLENGREIWFLAEVEQAYDYSKMIEQLHSGKITTKGRSGITEKEVLYVGKNETPMYDQPHAPYSFDAWLDLDNNLVIARSEQILLNLKKTIPNSVNYMNGRKGQ